MEHNEYGSFHDKYGSAIAHAIGSGPWHVANLSTGHEIQWLERPVGDIVFAIGMREEQAADTLHEVRITTGWPVERYIYCPVSKVWPLGCVYYYFPQEGATLSHFGYRLVPSGQWARIDGTVRTGEDDVDRPHMVPVTDAGRRFMELDVAIGRSGLTPGIIDDAGRQTYAYRFIELPTEAIETVIAELNQGVADFIKKSD